jgi:ribose transport system permease protein
MIDRLKNNFIKNKIIYYSYATAVIMYIAVMFIVPGFGVGAHIKVLMNEASLIGMMALGQTFVIITGGIDLSVGSTLAVSSLVCAMLMKNGVDPVLAMLAAVILGVILGLASGVLVTRGRLQPFIATLITMTVYRGFTLILSGGKPVSGLIASGDTSAGAAIFDGFGKGMLWEIPVPVIVFFVFFGIFMFVLSKTVTGRKIYATGSNEKAAMFSGINVDKVKISVSVLCSTLAGFAGIIYMARFTSATATFGQGHEMTAISAAVIGGASLTGGKGTVLGAVLGITMLQLVTSSLTLLNINPYWQTFITGMILLTAISLDSLGEMRKAKRLA